VLAWSSIPPEGDTRPGHTGLYNVLTPTISRSEMVKVSMNTGNNHGC
jgi:hypothetical protein